MVRKLKYHEQKLLKKVNFFQYKGDNDKENLVMRRYVLKDRQEYIQYNRICGLIRKLTHLISLLDEKDPYRESKTQELLLMLKRLGVVKGLKLSECEDITVSAFCRRRLSIVLTLLKMAEHPSQAVKYVEQGHVRIGPNVILDPALLVPTSMQDFITWTDDSKIKKKVLEYNERLDHYDNPGL